MLVIGCVFQLKVKFYYFWLMAINENDCKTIEQFNLKNQPNKVFFEKTIKSLEDDKESVKEIIDLIKTNRTLKMTSTLKIGEHQFVINHEFLQSTYRKKFLVNEFGFAKSFDHVSIIPNRYKRSYSSVLF